MSQSNTEKVSLFVTVEKNGAYEGNKHKGRSIGTEVANKRVNE
ncbi:MULTISPECIES: hypothetical protein [Bacillaceae]|nr:hypothetical protein [Bacillus sp. PK3_68]